ncbi:hypothetical protein WBG78_09150 [Chryseolinea sp. T2]|uniref:hypothetical protein n=1 Tax=Chryseolinea sp. T2 TaxID=3129255 RepID=UPI0030775F13
MKTLLKYFLSICLLVSSVYTLRNAYAHGLDSGSDSAEVICPAHSASDVQLTDQQTWCTHVWIGREKTTHVIQVPVLERRENEEDEDEFRSLTRFGPACITSVFLALSSDKHDLHRSAFRYCDLFSLPSSGRYLMLQVFRI